MNEGLNTSKPNEHLNLNIKGVKPIVACVGSQYDYYNSEQTSFIRKNFYKHSNNAHNIDYDGIPDDLEKRNFLNGGWNTYVLSIVDNSNKFSEGFCDCTGIVIAGIDKETGKNISFLSHQDPKAFLFNKKDDFINHLKQRLIEIKDRCVAGTTDAVVVGGNYLNGTDRKGFHYKQKYLNSVKLLSLEIKNVLGFEPVIINGPKTIIGQDDLYYDNENRRLYFVRPEVNYKTGSFNNSKIEAEKKKWE
jgi:hypothetical protein